MVLRLLGAVLVITSCTFIGFIYSCKNDFRISELNEVKKMLSVLKSEIEFGLSTMPEALRLVLERIEKPLSGVVENILKDMEDNREGGIALIWRENFANMGGSYLINKDINALADLSKTLGYADADIQIRGINEVDKYIDMEISEIYRTNMRAKKMYQSMGVLCGLLVVTVLI